MIRAAYVPFLWDNLFSRDGSAHVCFILHALPPMSLTPLEDSECIFLSLEFALTNRVWWTMRGRTVKRIEILSLSYTLSLSSLSPRCPHVEPRPCVMWEPGTWILTVPAKASTRTSPTASCTDKHASEDSSPLIHPSWRRMEQWHRLSAESYESCRPMSKINAVIYYVAIVTRNSAHTSMTSLYPKWVFIRHRK